MAVNVTEEPAHVGLVPDVIAIVTDGVTLGFTVIVIVLDVTVAGLAQVAFEVILQLTISPLANVVDE